mgnify:FL=1
MNKLGISARHASRAVALAPAETKKRALEIAADTLRRERKKILALNTLDLVEAKKRGVTAAFLDRLSLDTGRIESIATSVELIARLADPVGRIMARFERPNGLIIERVSTPLGVVGVIFESRPNVTADAGALCLKAGNATILRGGSESLHTSRAIHACLVAGLEGASLPSAAISFVDTPDRAAVGAMLSGLNGAIDVIVPRGGKSLVARVQHEARVPVFAHLEGIVHVYVHESAKLEMAMKILMNAKMRRTGICGATETLLVDRACVETHLRPLIISLLDAGCEVRGDLTTQSVDSRVKSATEEDWSTEYLDAIVSARVVDDLDAAIKHIETYGSHHTDCIISEDLEAVEIFMQKVDSAIVMHNASTQFADGGEFGFGAEIGIATGRMHARGPVGVEQLTSFNYRVYGQGQVRD